MLVSSVLAEGITAVMPDPTKRRRWFQFNLRTLLIVVILLSMLSVSLVVTVTIIEGKRERQTGPVTSLSRFPSELRQLLKLADQREVAVEELEVYCVQNGMTEEWFWQMKASPDLLNMMTEDWRLGSVEDGFLQYVWTTIPTSWCVLPPVHEAEVFQADGTALIVIHDKGRERLVVWYYLDF